MFSRKSSKSTVAASAISLVICFAMLLGATFAWFTATSSKAVASIKSGTVAVDFVDAEGVSLVGDTLAFVDAQGAKLPDVLWEPGCSYGIEPVYVKNTGKLAINYKVDVIGIDGQAKLLEVIDWKVNGQDLTSFEGTLVPGETSTLALSLVGTMDKAAGNQYQDLTADGIAIAVYATQVNADAEYADVAAIVTKMDTMPTVSVGEEDFTLETAYTFKTAETDVANSEYKAYNADYVITFNQDVAPNTVVLAGQYDNWSPDWEAFINPTAIAAGQPTRLLEGYNGSYVNYEEICTYVKEFNCGAYSEVSGLEMTVELRLYETVNNVETGEYLVAGVFTYTFGQNAVEVEAIVDTPVVNVDGADVKLDTAYTFTANEENVEESIYADYNADFVVSFNNAIPANAVVLAGQYDDYAAEWVTIKNPALAANETVRLVKDYCGGAITYVDVVNNVKEFNCGAKTNGVPAGTVMTVELRLYKTINGVENGEYITLNKCTYTFAKDLCSVAAIAAPTVDVAGTAVTLDKAYNFKSCEAGTAYADYNADYVVYFDSAVAADTVILAGQYDFYGPEWVSVKNPALAANQGVRLGTEYFDATFTYDDVCNNIKEFNCGVKDNGVAAGTVMTVELRLYETVNGVENGNYVVAESVSYTF